MDVIVDHGAALDVHKDSVMACVRRAGPGGRGRAQEVGEFRTWTMSLRGRACDPLTHGVESPKRPCCFGVGDCGGPDAQPLGVPRPRDSVECGGDGAGHRVLSADEGWPMMRSSSSASCRNCAACSSASPAARSVAPSTTSLAISRT